MPNKLILDTDGGVDDAQALLLLIANGRAPDAITTTVTRSCRPLAWAPVALGAALLLSSWLDRYPGLSSDEGFRDASRALHAAPSQHVTLCAAGAGAELFQWYVAEPLALPKTVAELRRATPGQSVAWCLYRPSSWESRRSAEIRRYLEDRGSAERFWDVLLLREHPQ